MLRVYTKALPTQQRFRVNVTLADGTQRVVAKFHEHGGEILYLDGIIPQPPIRESWGDVTEQEANEVVGRASRSRQHRRALPSPIPPGACGSPAINGPTSVSQTVVQRAEMRLLGNGSAPTAKGHAETFYKVYFGALNHDVFHLAARHLPPNTTLNVVRLTGTATWPVHDDGGGPVEGRCGRFPAHRQGRDLPFPICNLDFFGVTARFPSPMRRATSS